ncbi:hypothetical protein OIDMADRAFT_146754 [Oidiodendron maius Zn]|uniref:Xylanolytic transcriptional activator regulatory domain-containing protein n=1 Tax=Oidiodendron maius (strain Zn) TaxID=913774 RepID=A0A0C3GT13_OIDMZ|nr:hypothetical protein OIDMADRAFT_146754 [Oidiodendron maius Zn]
MFATTASVGKRDVIKHCPDALNAGTSVDEIQQIQARLMRLETLFLPQAYEFAFADDNSRESLLSQQPHRLSPPSSSWSKGPLNGVQQYLAMLANSVFDLDIAKITEEDICKAYFMHINHWLPIISQKKFYRQLAGDCIMDRRPETNLLLLSMYLLVTDPSSCEDLHKHYTIVRTAYFMLQAESTDLLGLAQSGLILATYEHTSGYLEHAYSTIWTCVRMIYSLQLEDKFPISLDNDHDKQTECVEARALHWAILIRDRFINLEDKMRNRPLASKHPSPDDYVPVNIGVWESYCSPMPLLKRRLSDRSSGQLSPDSFEREAKACYLLSQTLDWRRRGEATPHVRVIATTLEEFLSHLMDPSTGTRGTFCSAMSMTIISYNPVDDILIARSRLHLSRDAKLVLSTMTRIVTDIANTFNENFATFNIATISPSYPYLMYRASMHILLTTDINNEKLRQDFYELRRCCWYFSRRWLVARTYLDTLETFASALEINLPHLGGFFKHNGDPPDHIDAVS